MKKEIIICKILNTYQIPETHINDNVSLHEAIQKYKNSYNGEIWKEEKNYIVTENGIYLAFFEENIKHAKS